MQSEELSAGQVLCEVLISTEMIKFMHWKFPQVGGGRIKLSVITGSDEVSELSCAIFRPRPGPTV